MSGLAHADVVSIGVSSQTLRKIAFVSATALARHTFSTPLDPWVVARDQNQMSFGGRQSSLSTFREDRRITQITPNPPDQ
jgi:hypothetical protein